MKKRICIGLAVILAVAAALLYWQSAAGQGTLLEILPEGRWLDFQGGAGGGTLRMPLGTILDTTAPEKYRVPEGLDYFTPETVREALKSQTPEETEPDQRLLDLSRLTKASVMNEDLRETEYTGVESFFAFGFRDSQGDPWAVWILKEGNIILQKPGGDRFFRDNGECYRTMKDRFGDREDIDGWTLEEEKTGEPERLDLRECAGTGNLLDLLPEGTWFAFRCGVGGTNSEGRHFMPELAPPYDSHPENYRIPEQMEYLDAPHVRRALKGCQVRALELEEYPRQMKGSVWSHPAFTGCECYFQLALQDEWGNWFLVDILDNGYVRIVTRSLGGGTAWEKLFWDENGCYKTLKKHFGDLEDLDQWRVEP